jgi:hypothetical protein
MSHSEAWVDIQPMRTTSTHDISQSDIKVIDTITDMLDASKEQSELPYEKISFFFSRINNILEYLGREDVIHSSKQSLYFRRKVMEKLEISEIDRHIAVWLFFRKNQNYKDRFDKSLQSIAQSMQSWTSYQDAINDCWVSSDKRYFDSDLRNFHDYKQLIKSYSIQKYGEILSKK